MKLKNIIKRLIWGYRANSEVYSKQLRKKGMQIGKGTVFIDPKTTVLDETRPWLIKIGQGCCFTAHVTVLTHDYGWSVIKAVYGDVIGSAKKVTIGDYVFVGQNSTILGGCTVGNNVVIGANSVITKNVPDNVVVAGNPAKIICTLDEYYKKRKKAELFEAVMMVNEYISVYGMNPSKEILREHFWLFENKYKELDLEFKSVMQLVEGTFNKSLEKFESRKPLFRSYSEFISFCKQEKNNNHWG